MLRLQARVYFDLFQLYVFISVLLNLIWQINVNGKVLSRGDTMKVPAQRPQRGRIT